MSLLDFDDGDSDIVLTDTQAEAYRIAQRRLRSA